MLDAARRADGDDVLGELGFQLLGETVVVGEVLIAEDVGDGAAALRVIASLAEAPELALVTEYSLGPDDRHLRIETQLRWEGGDTLEGLMPGDVFAWGSGAGWAPGHGESLPETASVPWLAGVAPEGGVYVLGWEGGERSATFDGDASVTSEAVALAPGEAVTHLRLLTLGEDLPDAVAASYASAGVPMGTAELSVRASQDGWPLYGAEIEIQTPEGGPWLRGPTDWEGRASFPVGVGSWQAHTTYWSYLPELTWIEQAGDGPVGADVTLAPDPAYGPSADTITTILRPLPNLPAILRPGDPLEILCEAGADVSGWTASLAYGELSLALEPSAYFDEATGLWTLSAAAPEPPLWESWDLVVSADGVEPDTAAAAVRLIPAYRDNFYFAHVTDTHLPRHTYVDEAGWVDDFTEEEDLAEVIADLNLINPAFVLITGDLVNEGELEDYQGGRYFSRAHALLAQLRVPWFVVAGNHDVGGWDTLPPDGTARLAWWRFFGWRRLGEEGASPATQDYGFDYGPLRVLGLESWLNVDGWREETWPGQSFTDAQLAWLQAELDAHREASARVLFTHSDFSEQLDLGALGAELALYGHWHTDAGDLEGPPWSLWTAATCDGERAYRLIRVEGDPVEGAVEPLDSLRAGADGSELAVRWTPENDGTHPQVEALIRNEHPLDFEDARLYFLVVSGEGYEVEGGELVQVYERGGSAELYVSVDLTAGAEQRVVARALRATDTGGPRDSPDPGGSDDSADPGDGPGGAASDAACGCAHPTGAGPWLLLFPLLIARQGTRSSAPRGSSRYSSQV